MGEVASKSSVEGDVTMSSRERKCGLDERAFEVGHEGLGPRIEGIHDHLSVGWASDLDPPVLETGGRGRAYPRTFSTDASGLRGEIEFATIIELFLNGLPGLEEGLTGGLEGPVEGGQELDGVVGKDLCLSLWSNGGEDMNAFYGHECAGRAVSIQLVDG